MSHCRWNKIVVEYNIKTTTTTTTSKKTGKKSLLSLLNKDGNPKSNESYYRVRKTLYVSKFVLKNVKGSANVQDDDDQDDEDRIIRLLVLPGKPKSGLPRDEIVLTHIKMTKQVTATYVSIIIFICLYLYLSILIISLVGSRTSRILGWKYFICNFIWTPILPIILGKRRNKQEYKQWLYDDGEFITNDKSSRKTTTTTNRQRQREREQQTKPLLSMLDHDVDEEEGDDEYDDDGGGGNRTL